MLKFEKLIFNDEYIVFLDQTTNKKGIATPLGQIVMEAKYDHIYNSIGDWAIVAVKQPVKNIEAISYGIINSEFKEIFTPVYGFDAYLEMEKIIYNLNESKYGNREIRIEINKNLKRKKQPQ